MSDTPIVFPFGLTLARAHRTPAEFTTALVENLEKLIMNPDPEAEPFSIKIRAYMHKNEAGDQIARAVIQHIADENDRQEIDPTSQLSIAELEASVLYDLHDHVTDMYVGMGIEFLESRDVIAALMDYVDQDGFNLDEVNQRMALAPGPTKVSMERLLEINYFFEPGKLTVGMSMGFEYEINDAQSRREEAAALGLKVELPDAPRRQAFFYDERTFETLPIFN